MQAIIQYEAAASHFEKSVKFLSAIPELSGPDKKNLAMCQLGFMRAQNYLGLCHESIAATFFNKGNFDDAFVEFVKAKSYFSQIIDDMSIILETKQSDENKQNLNIYQNMRARAQIQFAYCCYYETLSKEKAKSSAEQTKMQYQEVVPHFEKAIDACTSILTVRQSDSAKQNLRVCWGGLAMVQMGIGRCCWKIGVEWEVARNLRQAIIQFKEALSYSAIAINILTAIPETLRSDQQKADLKQLQTESYLVQAKLGYCYDQIAIGYKNEKKFEQAVIQYKEAASHFEKAFNIVSAIPEAERSSKDKEYLVILQKHLDILKIRGSVTTKRSCDSFDNSEKTEAAAKRSKFLEYPAYFAGPVKAGASAQDRSLTNLTDTRQDLPPIMQEFAIGS